MNRAHNRLEVIAAIGLFILSAVYTADSLSLKIGSFTSPGPGLLPLITGILLVAATGTWLLKTIGSSKPASQNKDSDSSERTGTTVAPASIVMAVCVIAYPFILGILNFLFATFALTFPMLIANKSGRALPEAIIRAIIVAAIITIISFYLFSSILGVNLPIGKIELFFLNLIRGNL